MSKKNLYVVLVPILLMKISYALSWDTLFRCQTKDNQNSENIILNIKHQDQRYRIDFSSGDENESIFSYRHVSGTTSQDGNSRIFDNFFDVQLSIFKEDLDKYRGEFHGKIRGMQRDIIDLECSKNNQ